MSNLGKIITPIEGFQYSVNIAYDIYDDKKIRSYIPSNSSLQIIEDILASTDNKSTDRARILTGSYGKGKSHLILYTLALLAGRDRSLFTTSIEKAKIENPDLAKNICAYFDSGKKLLPVIVNANSLDIKSTLLQSLNTALLQAGLSNIMPTTFFDAAVSKIFAWKNNFPETYKSFEKKIGQSGESFISLLQDYDQSCYDLFVKIYPSLTSGSEFNPLAGSDVISVYESVIDELKTYGYNGIFVVYDEFGKFLEGSVDKSSAMDIKLIQDFAEKCNRSGLKQLHIMLISHKSIENYIGKLSKTKVDAWKAVSNRFKSISINNDESEIYDMVATVLNRDKERFAEYVEQHLDQFNVLKSIIERDHSFTAFHNENVEDFALRCYPLHPYTLLLLPKISELVAQNERTIFTFLSSTERYSVPYFLRTDNSGFPIIEPDYIYDYFEKLFRGEPYGSTVKKQWQITTSAISKLREYDNPLAEKIVKTLALIYCVNDFEIIPPSWDIICEIYSVKYRWGDIEAAKETLKKAHVLIELLYKPYVRITEGSGHDVLGLIQQEVYKIESITKAKDVFNNIYEIKYLYPVQYNDENEVIRYFDFRFIDYSDLLNIPSDGFVLDTKADGVVFAVLVKNDSELQRAIEYIADNHNKRAVFILPKECSDSESIAVNYQAILNLKKQYEGKEIELVEELNYILEDRLNVVNSFIENSYVRFDKNLSGVYYDGAMREVYRKAQLSQLLSSIMSEIYYRTPKIVNDLINKNQISATIKNARNKILTSILAGNCRKDMGLIGNGPELNILRSTLIIPGVFINTDNEPHLELECEDKKIRQILAEIRTHILQSSLSRHNNLGELYDVLTAPDYGYGLKTGVIPIYLAVVISQYKDHITLSKKGKELPLSASVLCDIEYQPKDYAVILEQWDEQKDIYIANLEDIFSQFVNPSDKINGSFVYIVKAMRRWYLQLTKYEVVTKKVCDMNGNVSNMNSSMIKFRNALSSPELNSHEFLFEQLFKIFECDGYEQLIASLRQAFQEINTTYGNVHLKLAREIKQLFGAQQTESLASVVANFYDDLKETTKEHLFSGKTSMFLDIAKHPNNDEFKLIETIGRALFNLRMSDFTDEIMSCYMSDFDGVIQDIKNYDEKIDESDYTQGYKITYTDESGSEITKQFDATEYTEKGQYLYNDITSTLGEFGDAVSSDEKRQILFRILKELI